MMNGRGILTTARGDLLPSKLPGATRWWSTWSAA